MTSQHADDANFVEDLTPRQIVAALDEHVVGQDDAKRAVAIALRNRWRRQQLDPQVDGFITRVPAWAKCGGVVWHYPLSGAFGDGL